MISDNNDQLAALLQRTDAATPVAVAGSLDTRMLLARAATRKRQRTRSRALLATSVVVLMMLGVHQLRLHDAPTENPHTKLAAITENIRQLELEAEALRQTGIPSFRPTYDVLTAFEEDRERSKPSLSELRSEIAALESGAAANDAELRWNMEWARSAALRLELARLEERSDPQSAEQAYRQIAATYAGTRWGEQAVLALREVAGP